MKLCAHCQSNPATAWINNKNVCKYCYNIKARDNYQERKYPTPG